MLIKLNVNEVLLSKTAPASAEFKELLMGGCLGLNKMESFSFKSTTSQTHILHYFDTT